MTQSLRYLRNTHENTSKSEAGVAHFGKAYEEYSRTGDWNAASNNAGISFSTTIKTDFGYDNSKDKQTGVIQNTPVVSPKTSNSLVGITRALHVAAETTWKEGNIKKIDNAKKVAKSIEGLVFSLEAAGMPSKYLLVIGKYSGNIATGAELMSNSYQFYVGEEKGGILGARFT